jgi:hypothetical protein
LEHQLERIKWYLWHGNVFRALQVGEDSKKISKRFVKKQQMRWTKEGAQQLLQVRIQVLNDELQQTFRKWYPGMGEKPLVAKNDKAA